MTGATARWSILICAMLVYLFLLGPLAVVIAASFDGGTQPFFRFPPQEISLRWYFDMPAKYWQSLALSGAIALTASLAAVLVGATAALGMARGSIRGRQWLETYFRFPLQVPFVVTGIVFLQFYYVLADFSGVSLVGQFAGYVIAHTFFCVPYAVGATGSVITRGLDQIENAARISGATEWRVFRRITIPALKPGLFSGFFFAFITSFGDVPVSVFLTSGGAVPLPVEIFQTLQFDYDPTVLSISTVVVVLSAAFIVGMQQLVGLDIVLPRSGR